MQNNHQLLNIAILLLAVTFSLSSLAGTTDASLQSGMNAVLKQDPRNSGIAVAVQSRSNPSVLFYDLRAVAPTNSMAYVFRVFLQFAPIERSRGVEAR